MSTMGSAQMAVYSGDESREGIIDSNPLILLLFIKKSLTFGGYAGSVP
jgi:hypothetical protein